MLAFFAVNEGSIAKRITQARGWQQTFSGKPEKRGNDIIGVILMDCL
jgi:hypothetical protein